MPCRRAWGLLGQRSVQTASQPNGSIRRTPRWRHGDRMPFSIREAKLCSPRSIGRHADFVTMTSHRLLLFVTLILTACGGGGDSSPSNGCAGSGTLSLTLTYEVNGQVVNPDITTVLARNVPVIASPRAVGMPASCGSATRWTFRLRSDQVPAGLTFDAATGVIRGTPTDRSSLSVEMKLAVDGYTSTLTQVVNFVM